MIDNLYIPNKIRTFTGKYINPFDPKPEEIDIMDITHALSRICRFNGHSMRFLSVAEHSVNVCNKMPPELKLQGLLHDASEAYLMDIPTPIKKQLHGYYEAEDNLMKMIADKFGFEYPFNDILKEADKAQLEFEWECMVLKDIVHPLDWGQAERRFIYQFNKLYNG